MPFTQLTPLDDQGVRSNRPSHEVKWRNLTNIIPRDGELRRRPGLNKVLGHDSLDLPTGQHGTVVAIGEIHNPGSSAEGRSGFEYASETIRPDATDSNSGWTRQDGSLGLFSLRMDRDDFHVADPRWPYGAHFIWYRLASAKSRRSYTTNLWTGLS